MNSFGNLEMSILTGCWLTVFQKIRKDDSENYRPVRLTSMPGKIMEIIQGGIEKHLEDNALIGHRKCGFIRGKVLLLKPDCLL